MNQEVSISREDGLPNQHLRKARLLPGMTLQLAEKVAFPSVICFQGLRAQLYIKHFGTFRSLTHA
jgi:hypothetical protein